MIKTGGIIFSRMNSRRLPGKALKMVSGKMLLERVIEASLKIKQINHICVATSLNPEDDILEKYANSWGIDVFRGNEYDVAMRAFNASVRYGYESFARICGDRPFIDYSIYDELIQIHNDGIADITTNIFPRVVPRGLSAEIIRVKSLERLISLTINKSDREHITKYFYAHFNKFKIQSVSHNNNFKKFIETNLTIDEYKDLQKARWILENHKKQKCNLVSESIIRMADIWETRSKQITN
jgi:spore coat polysaccharide biosynthesis protein SpsF